MQETWVQSLSWEDSLEKEIATTPVFLPGKSHEQRSLAGYNPWGGKRIRHDLATKKQQQGKREKGTWQSPEGSQRGCEHPRMRGSLGGEVGGGDRGVEAGMK